MNRLILILLPVLLLPVSARAGTTFVATFYPQPNTGSSGTGTGTFTVNTAGTMITFDD